MYPGILLRLKYIGATLGVLALIVALGWYLVVVLVYVVYGLAWVRHDPLPLSLVRAAVALGYFAVGALFAGGALALLNAVVSPRPFWFKSVFIGAVAGGVLNAVVPAYLMLTISAITTPSPTSADEEAAVIAFVKTDGAVIDAVGRDSEVKVVAKRLDKDSRTVVRYELSAAFVERLLPGERGRLHEDTTVYAIVDVTHLWRHFAFSLASVTRVRPVRSETDPSGTARTQTANVSSTIEYDTDRGGSDYANFDLPTANPSLCQSHCLKDVKCLAWAYVKPGTTQGPRPRCWLKNSVPYSKPDPCCVSGIKRTD